MTEGDDIAIVDLADELQVRKQRIFKILPRLGIRPTQRRDSSRGNQNVAIVSRGEAAAIRSEIDGYSASSSINGARPVGAFSADDVGFFYLIQLEPEHAWERAAIDCITAGCDQLHTEVFRAVSLTPVSERGQAFFSMMPGLEAELRSEEAVNDDGEPAAAPDPPRPAAACLSLAVLSLTRACRRRARHAVVPQSEFEQD